jgi:hypothetical protein
MKVVQHIPAGKLIRIRPGAECCDCMKQAEFAPEEQAWTIYRENIVYCPACAKREMNGPND